MFPKEHGGWAMLLIPYVIGLGVAAGFGLESLLFLLCILLVFMASEPFGIIIRARQVKGKRKNPNVIPAVRWLLAYLTLAGLTASPIILIYERWWLILFGVLGAAFLGFQGFIESRRLDRTTLGELIGALGLSLSAPGAYYVATGELGLSAFLLWLLTALHSAGSVFHINMRLRHYLAKGQQKGALERLSLGRDTLLYLGVLMVVLTGLSYLGRLPLLALVAFLPLVCRAAKSIYEAKAEFSFKHVGLVELANSIVFAALIILSYMIS